MTRYMLTVVLLAFLAACRDRAPVAVPEAEEPPAIAVTRWTGVTELFMEYPPLVARETGRFAIHLTRLKDFHPVTEGRAVVRLIGPVTQEFVAEAPSRPGIFGVDVTPSTAGTYRMQIQLSGPQAQDVHDLQSVVVHDEAAKAAVVTPAEAEGGISFLKEQQWALDFGTALAARRMLQDSLIVQAEITPRPGGDAVVAAPIAGRVVRAVARPAGSRVAAGETLAEIVPRDAVPADRLAIELELKQAAAQLELATAERERAERLLAEGAVPGRRVAEARSAESRAHASVDAARARLAQLDLVRAGRGAGLGQSRYSARAPIGGVIASVSATQGATVEEGTPLFRVVAVDLVHVMAHVPEAEAVRLPEFAAAEIVTSVANIPVGRLLSRGRVVDASSRTVPVIFEWRTPDPSFAIGQTVSLRLLAAIGQAAVAVQETAIVDDAGRPVVFVQSGGETFERRAVTLGRRAGGFVEVREGVSEGDRVVVRGAPLVRLAALSTQVPAHGHVH